MKYLEKVWFIMFSPGKRDGIVGYSDDIIRDDVSDSDDDEEEKNTAKETELAQQFERNLTHEQPLQRSTDVGRITYRLCGWQASSLFNKLESAQFAEAIQTLPSSHPMQRAMWESVFGSFGRGRSSRLP